MWLPTFGQSEFPNPESVGPWGLVVAGAGAFLAAIWRRYIRWGSEFTALEERLSKTEARAEAAEERERQLRERLLEITDKKDDEISEIRDRLEEKLTRANDVLTGVTQALKDRGI